jgi:hypothetical protein
MHPGWMSWFRSFSTAVRLIIILPTILTMSQSNPPDLSVPFLSGILESSFHRIAIFSEVENIYFSPDANISCVGGCCNVLSKDTSGWHWQLLDPPLTDTPTL